MKARLMKNGLIKVSPSIKPKKRTLKEQLCHWMFALGFSTGHGDTFDCLLKELEWQIKELRALAAQAPKPSGTIPAREFCLPSVLFTDPAPKPSTGAVGYECGCPVEQAQQLKEGKFFYPYCPRHKKPLKRAAATASTGAQVKCPKCESTMVSVIYECDMCQTEFEYVAASASSVTKEFQLHQQEAGEDKSPALGAGPSDQQKSAAQPNGPRAQQVLNTAGDSLTRTPVTGAAPASLSTGRLTFKEFARVNRQRCESKEGFSHALNSWSTSDWFTALFGELGEAANIAKKLNRIRDSVGVRANKGVEAQELQAKLRQELGDGFVYLDLLAQSLGFQISDAAVEVFNAKSKELNCPIVLEAALKARNEQAFQDGADWKRISGEAIRKQALEQAIQLIDAHGDMARGQILNLIRALATAEQPAPAKEKRS